MGRRRQGRDRPARDRSPVAEEHGPLTRGAAFVCDQFGVDVDRPLICQVSRFDPWKDPLGVIDAYRIVKEERDVQLALVGSMATDDPEGLGLLPADDRACGRRRGHKDPQQPQQRRRDRGQRLPVPGGRGPAEVLREGFGLTISEALWKVRPTIAGNVGGIPLQIQDGVSGFLVDSPEETAQRSIEILGDPPLGKQLGRSGKEYVRTHFLMPRLLRDWLRIFTDLS
jgi:trehalose synthase